MQSLERDRMLYKFMQVAYVLYMLPSTIYIHGTHTHTHFGFTRQDLSPRLCDARVPYTAYRVCNPLLFGVATNVLRLQDRYRVTTP